MKAILYFRLPDDKAAFDIASRSVELREALSDFREWLAAMKKETTLCTKSLRVIEAEFTGLIDDFDLEIETKCEFDALDYPEDLANSLSTYVKI